MDPDAEKWGIVFQAAGGMYIEYEPAVGVGMYGVWWQDDLIGAGTTAREALGEARTTLLALREARLRAAARAAEMDTLVSKISGGVERLATLGRQISHHPVGAGQVLVDLRALERKVQELNQHHFSM